MAGRVHVQIGGYLMNLKVKTLGAGGTCAVVLEYEKIR
jgi:hypothetical protein